jgi:hypothetical protein
MGDSVPVTARQGPRSATQSGYFGLYRAADFQVANGKHGDLRLLPSARWYFENETIAVPRDGVPIAGYARGIGTFDEVRGWHAMRGAGAPIDYPPLIWIAAPDVVHGARLRSDGRTLDVAGTAIPIELEAPIPLNRSYYDASSTRFFVDRSLAVRGHFDASGRFVVRVLWPEDFCLCDAPPTREWTSSRAPRLRVRELMREEPAGGARSPFAAFTLWRKPSAADDWRGRAVLAFVVNGAQGDDDEAHAGHFGVVTGRIADDGAIDDWLVNNFYTLDSESEKGILAAPVPLDNYLADLNSGQSYYRPSYLLVAVLADDRAANLVQSAFGRVYSQFYRHQLVYYHPITNCTSICVDTLRALGLDIPARGPTSPALAWAGFPWLAAKERSIEKAMQAFDYLTVDQTRLMPAAAIEDIFECLWALCHAKKNNGARDGTLADMLAHDIDALAFLRFPQIPSSRAWGDAPVIHVREYRSRLPRDRSKMQIVPVPPRPFPDDLRDDDLLPPPAHPSRRAALVWGMALAAGIALLIGKVTGRANAADRSRADRQRAR